MLNERVKKIASEILKEAMPMMFLDPTRTQSRDILKSLRDYYGVGESQKPVWREYITYREGTSNKFHYFSVFEKQDGTFAAANAYGRIGYDSKVVDLGSYSSKEQALNVAKTKLRKKLAKGYSITPLVWPTKEF